MITAQVRSILSGLKALLILVEATNRDQRVTFSPDWWLQSGLKLRAAL